MLWEEYSRCQGSVLKHYLWHIADEFRGGMLRCLFPFLQVLIRLLEEPQFRLIEKNMTMATTEQEQIQQPISKFLTSHFRIDFTKVNEQTDLFQEGLIDSFGFVELVGFLEKTFKIRFDEKEFTTNSLNTVSNIVSTVQRKTSA